MPTMDRLFSSIKIVDCGSIYPFERSDQKNESYSLGSVLHHPFLVTPLGEGTYVLLEDTSLFDLVTQAGIHHVPTLICPPEELHVTCPTLALTQFAIEDLHALAARHADQICLDLPGVVGSFLPVHMAFPSQLPTTIYLRHSSRTGCSAALDHLFTAISNNGRYYPLINPIQEGDTLVRFGVGGTLLTLPDATLDDLKAAASTAHLYPGGLIAIQAALRAYSLDIPFSILAEDSPLEDKATFLKELISLRLQSQRTTVVSGHVYILNK
jgi:hypothetical protein